MEQQMNGNGTSAIEAWTVMGEVGAKWKCVSDGEKEGEKMKIGGWKKEKCACYVSILGVMCVCSNSRSSHSHTFLTNSGLAVPVILENSKISKIYFLFYYDFSGLTF